MVFALDILIFFVVFVISHYVLSLWQDKKKNRHKYPPALPFLPLVGSLPFITGYNNVSGFFMRTADKLGPIFTLKVGNKLILVLNTKDAIEKAYLGHSFSFSGRHHAYVEQITNPYRKGLSQINSTPEWKKYKQLTLSILKEFGFGVMNKMETMILTEVEAMVDFVRKKSGQAFDPKDIIGMVSGNIMSNIILGHRCQYELGISDLILQLQRFMEAVDLTFDIAPIVRFLPIYGNKIRRLVESMEKIKTQLSHEINESINGGKKDCFIGRYLEKEGINCDMEQLLYSIRDLIFAGADTTINSLLWSLIALANNQEVQNNMRSEIDEVLSKRRYPKMDDQNKLPFVQATILEIMRWKTLVPLSVPRLTSSDDNLEGNFIPAGTLVLANLYAAHMNSKTWRDPDVFQPERFLDEERNVIGKDRVIPFSLGRRSCLGEVLARAELFLVISSLVQRFIILPPEGVDKVNEKNEEPVGLFIIPLPFNIRLVERA